MSDDFLTPRDGFRQMGLGRTLLTFLQAIVAVLVAIVVIFAMGLQGIH